MGQNILDAARGCVSMPMVGFDVGAGNAIEFVPVRKSLVPP